MDRKFIPFPPDFVRTNTGLGILRLAALLAEGDGELDEGSLESMFEQMEAGVLVDTAPAEMWPELVRGLMAASPAMMIRALRECGVLEEIVLPEVAALFGVPQIADHPAEVDLGVHFAECACRSRPPRRAFGGALLSAGDECRQGRNSPREHLPVHYRHIERGRPRIEAICDRFEVPAECRELALLAVAECERVHRVSEVRAGPVAMMLDRVRAFDDPALFKLLMILCACDYFAYGGRRTRLSQRLSQGGVAGYRASGLRRRR